MTLGHVWLLQNVYTGEPTGRTLAGHIEMKPPLLLVFLRSSHGCVNRDKHSVRFLSALRNEKPPSEPRGLKKILIVLLLCDVGRNSSLTIEGSDLYRCRLCLSLVLYAALVWTVCLCCMWCCCVPFNLRFLLEVKTHYYSRSLLISLCPLVSYNAAISRERTPRSRYSDSSFPHFTMMLSFLSGVTVYMQNRSTTDRLTWWPTCFCVSRVVCAQSFCCCLLLSGAPFCPDLPFHKYPKAETASMCKPLVIVLFFCLF